MIFTGPRPMFQVLAWLVQEVADADAAFQIEQQRAWNSITGRPLLEGYDRLANLGVSEVRVTVRLTATRRSWYRRIWNAMWGIADELRHRLHVPADGPPAMTIRATIGRDARGKWIAALDGEHVTGPSVASLEGGAGGGLSSTLTLPDGPAG